jgi:hypothetical protein
VAQLGELDEHGQLEAVHWPDIWSAPPSKIAKTSPELLKLG